MMCPSPGEPNEVAEIRQQPGRKGRERRGSEGKEKNWQWQQSGCLRGMEGGEGLGGREKGKNQNTHVAPQ